MSKVLRIFLRGLIFIVGCCELGCGPPPNAKSLGLDPDKIPSDPVIAFFTYTRGGVTITENPPYPLSRNIYPDLGTGFCSTLTSAAEVIISGTLDETKTDHLVLTGPTSQEITVSGSTFSIKTCLLSGSALISLRAVNSDNHSSGTLKVSINNVPALKTLAYGHPSYPSPGFQMTGSSARSKTTVGTLRLRQISIETVGSQTLNSTGNTSLTLSNGFTKMVGNVSP